MSDQHGDAIEVLIRMNAALLIDNKAGSVAGLVIEHLLVNGYEQQPRRGVECAVDLVRVVERILRASSFDLLCGRLKDVIENILTQLANDHDFRPKA